MSIKSKYTFGTTVPVEHILVDDFILLTLADDNGDDSDCWARVLENEAHEVNMDPAGKESGSFPVVVHHLRVMELPQEAPDLDPDADDLSGWQNTHLELPGKEFLVQRFTFSRGNDR